jgi:heme-degrading monooxygenase HmoA
MAFSVTIDYLVHPVHAAPERAQNDRLPHCRIQPTEQLRNRTSPGHQVAAQKCDNSPSHNFTGRIMILELVNIRIQPGKQTEFDAAVQRGLEQVIGKAKGYEGHVINKCIEAPERYVLQIYWATLENHTVDFRESPAFQEWRAVVSPFFAAPPTVEHFNQLSKSA